MYPPRALVPQGSFPNTASAYAALIRARIFKRQRGSQKSTGENTEQAGAAAQAPTPPTTAAVTGGRAEVPAAAAESGRPVSTAAAEGPAPTREAPAGPVAPPAAAQEPLFGKEDFERLQTSRTWKALLDYPQELFSGEYRLKEVPHTFELDWASLSTKKVPGFEPRKPAPWMHPSDVTAAVVAASYVNIDDTWALEAAAWCSNPHALGTGGGVARGTLASADSQDIRRGSPGGGDRKTATATGPSAVDTPAEIWDDRLERQRDAGSLHSLPVKLFTPVRENASQLPVNPILFTGSVSVACGTHGLAGFFPALHSQHAKQQQRHLPQDQEQLRMSAGCKVISYPQVHVRGRGILGKWGSNHAADVIVTAVNPATNKLQVVLIRRTDGSGQYAFPGGFVDDGDFPPLLATAVREFLEETVHFAEPAATKAAVGQTQAKAGALVGAFQAAPGDEGAASEVTRKASPDVQLQETLEALKVLFGQFERDPFSGEVSWESAAQIRPGNVVYAGYVDDIRNTDNAWVETVALHWHVPSSLYSHIHLRGGDDAAQNSAAFYDVRDDPRLVAENVDPLENLYSSHSGILRKMLEKRFPEAL